VSTSFAIDTKALTPPTVVFGYLRKKCRANFCITAKYIKLLSHSWFAYIHFFSAFGISSVRHSDAHLCEAVRSAIMSALATACFLVLTETVSHTVFSFYIQRGMRNADSRKPNVFHEFQL